MWGAALHKSKSICYAARLTGVAVVAELVDAQR